MYKQDTGQKGFTLVEIMIAVGIFAIGILGVGAMQIKSMETDSQSRTITDVATDLEQLVERISSFGYYDICLSDTDRDGSNEDTNNNGILDLGDDSNGDGVVDDYDGDGSIEPGEDTNDNGVLDMTDANFNGIDDRDETDPPPHPLFNFGLDDTFQVDPGTGVITTTSDHIQTIGDYTVYWNVAENQPTRDLKTIRAIIVWTESGRQRRITIDSVKPLT